MRRRWHGRAAVLTVAVWLLTAHVDDLRRQLEDRTREVGQLHTLLAQAHQRLLTDGLAAPAPAPETESAPSPEWEARRWWQRLLWG